MEIIHSGGVGFDVEKQSIFGGPHLEQLHNKFVLLNMS